MPGSHDVASGPPGAASGQGGRHVGSHDGAAARGCARLEVGAAAARTRGSRAGARRVLLRVLQGVQNRAGWFYRLDRSHADYLCLALAYHLCLMNFFVILGFLMVCSRKFFYRPE